jgi:hypothetical protein
VLIHGDAEISELLGQRHAYVSVLRAQYDAHITQMMGASAPVVSVAKVRSARQPKWNSSRLRRKPSRLANEEHGPPKRSKVTV